MQSNGSRPSATSGPTMLLQLLDAGLEGMRVPERSKDYGIQKQRL